MTKQVYIPDGQTNVELPNGYSYDGPETVTLTDEQYATIDGDAFTGGYLIDLSGEVAALDASASNLFVYRKRLDLASITAVADLDTFTPGFVGRVQAVQAIVITPVTTAGKAVTLNLEIGTTNLTGGAIALTSANCTPAGAVIAGTAVTAANTFDADDVLTLEPSSITAFTEGAVLFEAILVAT